MEWTPQQDAALRAVADWKRDSDQQVFRLFGYAGTGKTTLAKTFAENEDKPVFFGAYTGKAAHVLRTKGCPGAATIHSLIYRSKEASRARLKELEIELSQARMQCSNEGVDPEQNQHCQRLQIAIEEERRDSARPLFDLNPDSPIRSAGLVVVDECSMVDGQMGEDLLSFGVKVLVLGDPAQLPPVMGGGFFTEHVTPDVMLTDIQRQARDNPIIHMASLVREGGTLPIGNVGGCHVYERGHKMDPEDVLAMNQLLVGRNATRHAFNKRVRQLMGRESIYPETGDKLVCLRNNSEHGLLNGAQWMTNSCLSAGAGDITLDLSPMDHDGCSIVVDAHRAPFHGEKVEGFTRKEAEEFDHGYTMTVHKSQGSQWDDVLVVDESYAFREARNRWLYTAITRAAKTVTVLKT